MTVLTGWQNFYVIVGSSAGALIGLQFVIMTLITEMPGLSDVERASGAFATPTIVHFGAVLLLSALGTVPWPGIIAISILWRVLGLVGVVYALIVAKRMREQTATRRSLRTGCFMFFCLSQPTQRYSQRPM